MSGVLVMLAAVAVWWSIEPRLVPVIAPAHDAGTLLSVAERLRAGDRLYSGVWDNKDPYFYYLLALARSCSHLGSVVLEHCWVALAGLAVWQACRALDTSRPRALFAALCLAPLVATGSSYVAGLTHLPGVAVSVLAISLALGGRHALAGGTLAALCLLKLSMAPIAAAGVLTVLLDGPGRGRGLRRCGGALLVTALLALTPLVLRGELPGYLRAQVANVAYSGNPVLTGPLGQGASHLSRVLPADGRGSAVGVLGAVSLGLLLARPAGMLRPPRGRSLWLATAATLATGLLVTLRIGMWPHHGQVFEVPALLLLCLSWARVGGPRTWCALVGLALAVVLGGGVSWQQYRHPAVPVATSLERLGPRSPEARALISRAPSGRYARLGIHDQTAHARGLGAWTLGCRHFAQYHFDPPATFTEQQDCLESVDQVIVDSSFTTRQGRPDWNHFVAESEARLSVSFTCTREDFGRLCRRTR